MVYLVFDRIYFRFYYQEFIVKYIIIQKDKKSKPMTLEAFKKIKKTLDARKEKYKVEIIRG